MGGGDDFTLADCAAAPSLFYADWVEEIGPARPRLAAYASEAILAATEAGANLVSGPTLRVSDAEKASMSAYAAAYKAARLRADAYAGLSVSRVLAIRDGGQAGGEPMTMQDAMANMAPRPVSAEMAPPPPFNPGVNSSMVSVRVDFALSN